MTARETAAAALMVWLIGAVAGWCAGWAGRREQVRAWHRNLVRQLTEARAQLAEALDQLDGVRAQWEAERVPAPAPAVVHVHVAAPLQWPAQQPVAIDTARFLDAMPVLPAGEVEP